MANGQAPAGVSFDTFPKLLRRNSELYGARIAVREKDLGIWQSWTWGEVRREIERFAAGLAAIGCKKGEKIAIVGQNRPRLYWSMTAAQILGAVPVPVYADSVAEEMAYVLNHAEISYAVVEDQEQVDKLTSLSDQLQGLRTIIYDDDRGMRSYDHLALKSFEMVQALGDEHLKDDANRAAIEASISEGKGADIAVMLYTSGTTGRPKGVMLSFDNLIRSASNANAFDKLGADEETIAYLPMAWVGDHIFSFAQSYCAGYCVNCPESPETVIDCRREIAPSYFFAPPRVFEGMLTMILVRMEDAGKIKKAMFDHFMAVARRVGEDILDARPVGLLDRLHYALGEMLVYGPLKNRMGLNRLKVAYTAGEAIGPEIFRFYRALGINLKQLYGQTEASVYITMQPDGEIKADTVGIPAPEVEVRIADNGEVLYRSPGTFVGYFKNEDATRETKTEEGWVHTGDAGFFGDDGHLKIIDRAKDVGKLSDGALFAPKYIENTLKFYPNIKEAVAFGDGRDFCGVFLNIDLTAVGNWAERNNVAYGSYQELAAHPEVYKMIEAHVDEANKTLASVPMMAGAQVKRFLILHKELDADDGELTRTQKVRRSFIAERYAPLIDALYNGAERCQIRTEVTFEDGRKGVIEGDIRLVTMQAYDAAASGNRMEAAE